MRSLSDPGLLLFRRARAEDAPWLAPLVYASAWEEFQFLLGVKQADCEAFLQTALASRIGHFSWRHHHVAVMGDIPVSVIGVYDGRKGRFDALPLFYQLVRHFGWRHTSGILLRALAMQHAMPAPTRYQTLLAHCATHPEVRGLGLFSALLAQLQQEQRVPARRDQAVILDVLTSNVRAQALYRRLGFAITRERPDEGVPLQLAVKRMQLKAAPRNKA